MERTPLFCLLFYHSGLSIYHAFAGNHTLTTALYLISPLVVLLIMYFLFFDRNKKSHRRFAVGKILKPAGKGLQTCSVCLLRSANFHRRFLLLLWAQQKTEISLQQVISGCWKKASAWDGYYKYAVAWDPFFQKNSSGLLRTETLYLKASQLWIMTLESLFRKSNRLAFPEPNIFKVLFDQMQEDLMVDFYQALLICIEQTFRTRFGMNALLPKPEETMLNNILGRLNYQRLTENLTEQVSCIIKTLEQNVQFKTQLFSLDPDLWRTMMKNTETEVDRKILINRIDEILHYNRNHSNPEILYKQTYLLLADRKIHQCFSYYIKYCQLCRTQQISPDPFDPVIAEQVLQHSTIDRQKIMEIFELMQLSGNYENALAAVKIVLNRRFGSE